MDVGALGVGVGLVAMHERGGRLMAAQRCRCAAPACSSPSCVHGFSDLSRCSAEAEPTKEVFSFAAVRLKPDPQESCSGRRSVEAETHRGIVRLR